MCDPATAMTVLKVAGAVASYQQQSNAADAQNARYAENRQNAIIARDLKVRQSALRQSQEEEKTAEEQRALSLEALRKQSRAVVSAGESGVAGNSVTSLINSFEADRLRGLQTLERNQNMVNQQLATERDQYDAEMLNRIGSIAQASQPSVAGLALSVGGSLVEGGVVDFGSGSQVTGTAIPSGSQYAGYGTVSGNSAVQAVEPAF